MVFLYILLDKWVQYNNVGFRTLISLLERNQHVCFTLEGKKKYTFRRAVLLALFKDVWCRVDSDFSCWCKIEKSFQQLVSTLATRTQERVDRRGNLHQTTHIEERKICQLFKVMIFNIKTKIFQPQIRHVVRNCTALLLFFFFFFRLPQITFLNRLLSLSVTPTISEPSLAISGYFFSFRVFPGGNTTNTSHNGTWEQQSAQTRWGSFTFTSRPSTLTTELWR